MKIIATSDLHGTLPDPEGYPSCDVLVIAGDVCPNHDHSSPLQRSWLSTNFSEWLRQLPAEHVIGIGGNHDFELERNDDLARSLPWTYLRDESVVIDGVKFWGIPWVPNLSRWAFHLDDPRLDDKFALIEDDADVVVSHGPPHGERDLTVPRFGAVHAGFPGTHDMLKRVRPLLFICGHIHEGYGMEFAHDTIIANVSHMTEIYDPINAPMEFFVRSTP